jgi:hypothetical protein
MGMDGRGGDRNGVRADEFYATDTRRVIDDFVAGIPGSGGGGAES